jgi:protein MpaA
VTAPDGTYHELAKRWRELRADAASVRELTCPHSGDTLLHAEIGELDRPIVAIAAGLHGDERAGPWALLGLVEDGLLDPRCSYTLWPCVNPSGFAARTRENHAGIDVNRTFAGSGGSAEAAIVLNHSRGKVFALSLDLHEDCDARGFYCYEYGGAEIGRRVIEALDVRRLAIDPLESTFDLAGPLRDAHCARERGRIVASAQREAELLDGLSYSLAFARHAARRTLTFETPRLALWQTRIRMHRTAVLAAVAALLEESD